MNQLPTGAQKSELALQHYANQKGSNALYAHSNCRYCDSLHHHHKDCLRVMNSTIETILGHRSIRQYTDQPIDKQHLDLIVQAGLAASSSSLLQAVSIVRVTDKEKRKLLAEYAGNQAYVENAAEFLVFCIDYQRHAQINPEVKTDFTELTLIGAVD